MANFVEEVGALLQELQIKVQSGAESRQPDAHAAAKKLREFAARLELDGSEDAASQATNAALQAGLQHQHSSRGAYAQGAGVPLLGGSSRFPAGSLGISDSNSFSSSVNLLDVLYDLPADDIRQYLWSRLDAPSRHALICTCSSVQRLALEGWVQGLAMQCDAVRDAQARGEPISTLAWTGELQLEALRRMQASTWDLASCMAWAWLLQRCGVYAASGAFRSGDIIQQQQQQGVHHLDLSVIAGNRVPEVTSHLGQAVSMARAALSRLPSLAITYSYTAESLPMTHVHLASLCRALVPALTAPPPRTRGYGSSGVCLAQSLHTLRLTCLPDYTEGPASASTPSAQQAQQPGGSGATSNPTMQFAQALGRLSSLTSLSLVKVFTEPEPLLAVLASIGQLTGLTHLQWAHALNKRALEVAHYEALSATLACLSALRSLDLSGSWCAAEDVVPAVSHMLSAPALAGVTRLNLGCLCWNRGVFDAAMGAAAHMPGLQDLTLGLGVFACEKTPDGPTHGLLAGGLGRWPVLHSLTIARAGMQCDIAWRRTVQICDVIAPTLSSLLEAMPASLQSLVLELPVAASVCGALATGLAGTAGGLREVQLQLFGNDVAGARAIAAVLQRARGLQRLEVGLYVVRADASMAAAAADVAAALQDAVAPGCGVKVDHIPLPLKDAEAGPFDYDH